MMEKKRVLRSALVASTALFLAACGEELPEDMPEGGGEEGEELAEEFELDETDDSTLMIGLTNAPDTLNPFYRPGTAATWVQRFFYDSLLVQPEADEFGPALATSIETEDNQVFTVNIDPEANWSDGEPVTAQDVAFTLNYVADIDVESASNTYVSMIEGTDSAGIMEEGLEELPGLEVVDDKTLEITTKHPIDLALVQEFIGFNILIAPQHVFEDIEKVEIPQSEPATNPTVFSGPYEFVEYQENDYVHLQANESFNRGTPEIQNIYMRIMNGTALITEFQAGNLHMTAGGGIGMVPVQDVDILENVEGLVVEDHAGLSAQYFTINSERFPDQEVRQAFAYAMDFDSTVENLLFGMGETMAAPYTSATPYRHETLEPYPHDPEQAQELLESVDFDFDEPISFGVPVGNATREQNGDLIEQWLVDVGLNINQENYDFPTWLALINDNDYDIGLVGWPHTVDPDLSTYVHSSVNGMTHDDPHIDELLEEGMRALDFDERYEIYAELQEYLHEQAYVIPLYAENDIAIRVDYLDGGIKEFWAGSIHDVHEWTINPPE